MKSATVIGPLARICAAELFGERGHAFSTAPAARPARGPDHDADADDDHRDRQQHALGQPAGEIADLDVGLAEELGEGARDAIAGDEGAGDEAGRGQLVIAVGQQAQDEEEHDAFQRRLVELARMARNGAAVGRGGKHTSPRARRSAGPTVRR